MNKKQKICIITSLDCNLSCVYCYERKERIAFDVKKTITVLSELLSNSCDCYIEFYGGEPLLHLKKIKQVCEFVWNNFDVNFPIIMTTNGTLVHGKVKDWLIENKYRVKLCLSIDGNLESHNLNRSNSFERIDQFFFISTWKDSVAKLTVSPLTIDKLFDNIKYLHLQGFKKILVNFAQLQHWGVKSSSILDAEMQKLCLFYLESKNFIPCSLFDINFENLGLEKVEFLKGCGIGEEIVIGLDGEKYPCRMLIPEIVGKKIDIDFNDMHTLVSDRCFHCSFLKICKTCYAANYLESGFFSERNRYLCSLNRVRFKNAANYFINRALTTNAFSVRLYRSLSVISKKYLELSQL